MTYLVRDMSDWHNVNADLIITDPPFGISFSGKPTNYNRNSNLVVEGYQEWEDYEELRARALADVIAINLSLNGQALVFSGWNHSDTIRRALEYRGSGSA